jgi:TolA-binding protein
MKAHVLFLILVAVVAANGVAQTAPPVPAGAIIVHLKNGTSITSSGVRRVGGDVAVTVQLGSAGRSENRHPLATLVGIDFPKPQAIGIAEGNLAANNAASALSAISPVVAQQEAFQDLPGNWWAKAATIKVKALVALGRYEEAAKQVDALAKHADPEDIRAARLQIAIGWAKNGDAARAQPVFDEAIAQSGNHPILATAWIGKGDVFLAGKDYDSALLAYLRVPIFYPDEKDALPPALLGSARAYLHLGEAGKAREIFQQIVSTYPKSPSAAAAQAALKELDDEPGASGPS